jgi:ADP-ribosylglycohydrolase
MARSSTVVAGGMSYEDSTVGAMLGLAVGDALGAQVEFVHPQQEVSSCTPA